MFTCTMKILKSNKKKTVFIIVSIMLVVTSMLSLIQLGDSLAFQYKKDISYGNRQDFSIQNIDVISARAFIDNFKESAIGATSTYLQEESSQPLMLKNNGDKQFIIKSGSFRSLEQIKDYSLIEGKYPSQAYEIALDKTQNNLLVNPYKIGDEISFEIPTATEVIQSKLYIVGFMDCLTPPTTTSSDSLEVWTIDSTFHELRGRNNTLETKVDLDVMVDRNKTLSEFGEEGIELFTRATQVMIEQKEKGSVPSIDDYDVAAKIVSNEEKDTSYDNALGYDKMGKVIQLFSLVVAFCMVLLIFNMLHLSILNRIHMYGVFRCVGLSVNQLFKMLLYEYMFYACIGIGLGFLLGSYLNILFADVVISYLIAGQERVLIQSGYSYTLTFLLSFGAIIVSMALLYRKMRKLSPCETHTYIENNKVSLAGKHPVEKQMTLCSMAYKYTKKNRTKRNTTILSLTVSILLVLVLLNIVTTLTFEEKFAKEEFINYEVFLGDTKTQPFDENVYEATKRIDGVEAVYAASNFFNNTMIDESNKKDIIYFIYDDRLMDEVMKVNKIPIEEGKDIHTLLIHSNKQEHKPSLAYEKGDVIDVSISERLGQVKDKAQLKIDEVITGSFFQLEGMSSALQEQSVVIIRNSKAKEIWKETFYTNVLINFKDGIQGEQQQALTKIFYPYGEIKQTNFLTKEMLVEKQLLGDIILGGYILVIAVFTGVLNFTTIVTANIKSRLQVYGILRSLGMTKFNVIRMNCIEGMMYWCCAAILSFILAIAIQFYFSTIAYNEFDIHWQINYLILFISGCLCYLVTYSISKKAISDRIIDNLQEELE